MPSPRREDLARYPVRYYVALGLLTFTVLFWRLGATTFWDPDEAHYAQTSRELVMSGNWLVPYYNDQPFFDKPVLFHLFQAVPITLLGPTETAARLVPALAALAIIGVTWWLGAVLVSADVGFVAALLLTSNPAVFSLARYAILDTTFTAFLFGAAALLTVAALDDRPRLQYGGYVLLALATLTKGPVAIVLSGAAFLIAIAISSDARRRLFALRWGVGLVIVIGLSAPWFLYMWGRFGDRFVDAYILNENLRLFGRPMYRGQPAWWFYFGILGTGLLPWTGLMLGRLYDDVRARLSPAAPDTFEVLLWAWIAAIVGFFTFSRFKLDHYVFPAAPALCLICARAWAELRSGDPQHVRAGARVGLLLVGPILVVAGLVAGFLTVARMDLPRPALTMAIALALAGVGITVRSVRSRQLPRAPWIATAAIGALYAGVLIWVVPQFDQRKVVPDVARWVASHAGSHERIGAYLLNRWNPTFRFYVERHTTLLEGPDTARVFFNAPDRFYCVMLEPAYKEFIARGIPLRIVYSRDGMWATSGRALWREKAASTRFVVVTRAD